MHVSTLSIEFPKNDHKTIGLCNRSARDLSSLVFFLFSLKSYCICWQSPFHWRFIPLVFG